MGAVALRGEALMRLQGQSPQSHSRSSLVAIGEGAGEPPRSLWAGFFSHREHYPAQNALAHPHGPARSTAKRPN
jgi:hypothetical protein